jgi:hypothetical protein
VVHFLLSLSPLSMSSFFSFSFSHPLCPYFYSTYIVLCVLLGFSSSCLLLLLHCVILAAYQICVKEMLNMANIRIGRLLSQIPSFIFLRVASISFSFLFLSLCAFMVEPYAALLASSLRISCAFDILRKMAANYEVRIIMWR